MAETQQHVIRRGEEGDVVALATNFVRVQLKPGKGIFEYRVEFDPPTEALNLKRQALRQALRQYSVFKIVPYTFDGQTLYLPVALNFLNLKRIAVSHPFDPTMEKMGLTFKFIKRINLTDSAQVYNILMKNVQRALGRKNVQGNFYDMSPAGRIPEHKLEIVAGVTTRIDEVEGGLMMCLDLCHKVLRCDTALDYWYQLKTSRKPGAEERYKEFMTSQIVLANYGPRRVYRVDDVDFNTTPVDTFDRHGQQTTYIQYYRKQYNLAIRDRRQPLLISKPKTRRSDKPGDMRYIALIPELCRLGGLSYEQTQNYSLMKKVGALTRIEPQERAKTLTDFIRKIKECAKAMKILDDWGLKFEEELVRVEGRIIDPPELNFHSGAILGRANFSAEVATSHCFRAVQVSQFAVFCIGRDSEKAKDFIVKYNEVCRSSGIGSICPGGQVVLVRGTNPNDFQARIADFVGRVQFVVVITPSNRADVYSAIKRFCIVEKAIPSQVIRSRTLDNRRALHSVIEKVALQINCKLGGALWALSLPHRRRIMFVGMDVYHAPGRKSPSVLGFVASMDTCCTQYVSKTMKLKPHQEIADSLMKTFVDALEDYRDMNNGFFPDQIIVFRDGVSDGQWDHVKKIEVEKLKEAIGRTCSQAAYTFCVVQKRITERLFSVNGPKFGNTLPGTILDHTVTRRGQCDFFLVSQSVRQGTVSPTHFIVLEDTARMEPDVLQNYAYATTFMYYNWSGTISVPAMCKYAHTLAHQSGQYLDANEANGDLRHKLYFI